MNIKKNTPQQTVNEITAYVKGLCHVVQPKAVREALVTQIVSFVASAALDQTEVTVPAGNAFLPNPKRTHWIDVMDILKKQ